MRDFTAFTTNEGCVVYLPTMNITRILVFDNGCRVWYKDGPLGGEDMYCLGEEK